MPNEHKIKQSDVAALRKSLLRAQFNRCALCDGLLDASEAALDHDHSTGRVRGVIHRDCNILLGKIENFVGRYGKKMEKDDQYGLPRLYWFLKYAYSYRAKDYSRNPLHYRHKTEEDKLLAKYRRLVKRSKKVETKEKYKALIKEITDGKITVPNRKGKGKSKVSSTRNKRKVL